MIQKILGFLLLGCAVILAWFSIDDRAILNSKFSKLRPPATFSDYVSNDLENLRTQGALPKEWAQIQHVAYQLHTPFQKELIGERKISAIPETPNGKYKLEIEFIDVPDEENPGLILQMSMMDLETKNKVWELGRTYALKSFLKKEKTEEATKPQSSPVVDPKSEKQPPPPESPQDHGFKEI